NAASGALSNLAALSGGGAYVNGPPATVGMNAVITGGNGANLFGIYGTSGVYPAGVLIGSDSSDALGFFTNANHSSPGIILHTDNSVAMSFYGAGVATFDASGNITSVAGGGKQGAPGRPGRDGEDAPRGARGITGATGSTGAQGVPGVSRRVQFHDELHMGARGRTFDPRNIDGPVVINGSATGTGAATFNDGGGLNIVYFNSTAASGGIVNFQRSGVAKA